MPSYQLQERDAEPLSPSEWSDAYDGLRPYLASLAERNDFMRSLASDLARYGRLTPAQTNALIRFYLRDHPGTDAPVPAGTVAVSPPATRDELAWLPNGTYTMERDGEHMVFTIHTVQRGQLEGKRIIKHHRSYDRPTGFAFLCADGSLRLWRRFAADDGQPYVQWARDLLRRFVVEHEQGTNLFTWLRSRSDGHGDAVYISVWDAAHEDLRDYTVRLATRCRRCNRPLEVPDSIDAGLGPDCAGREGQSTTRAAARTTDPDDDQVEELPDRATLEEDEVVSDQGVSLGRVRPAARIPRITTRSMPRVTVPVQGTLALSEVDRRSVQ